MADVFTKAKRSEVMSRIRSRGNRDTKLALARLLRANGISGWRKHVWLKFRVPSQAGLRLPQVAHGDFRGRLFLARLPEARDAAEEQSRVLAA